MHITLLNHLVGCCGFLTLLDFDSFVTLVCWVHEIPQNLGEVVGVVLGFDYFASNSICM